MRRPPPTEKGTVTIEQIVESLPDRGRSCWHLGAVWALSQFQDSEVSQPPFSRWWRCWWDQEGYGKTTHSPNIVVLLCAWLDRVCLSVEMCQWCGFFLCSARYKPALSEKLYFYSEGVFQPKLKILNSSMTLSSKDAGVRGRRLQRHKGFSHPLPQQC